MKKLIQSFAFLPIVVLAQGSVDSPAPNSTESGIDVIYGWHCTAKKIDAQIDGVPIGGTFVGSERGDTASTCGKTATGYSLLMNFNNLSEGAHNLKMYADGVVFKDVSFNTIKSGGIGYLQGAVKEVTVPDFPKSGQTAALKWVENKQNFVITKISGVATPPPTTPPVTGVEKLYGLVTLNYRLNNSSNNYYTDTFRPSSLNIINDKEGKKSLKGQIINSADREYYCIDSFYDLGCFIFNPNGSMDMFDIRVRSDGFISGNYDYCAPSASTNVCLANFGKSLTGVLFGSVNKSKSGGYYIESYLSDQEIQNLKIKDQLNMPQQSDISAKIISEEDKNYIDAINNMRIKSYR